MSFKRSQTATDSGNSATRKRVFRLLRVIVSVGLAIYIVSNADLLGVFAAMAVADWSLVACGLGLQLIGVLIVSLRYQTLLSADGVTPGLRYLYISTLCSNFFRQFLPSTLGGDALRGYDAWKAGASKTFAVLSLFVDRLVGLCVLVTMFLIAILFVPSGLIGLESARLWGGIGLAATCAIIVVLFFQPTSLRRGFDQLAGKLPSRAGKLLQKISEASSIFSGKSKVLLVTLALSATLHMNNFLFFWVLSKSLGFEISFWEFWIIVPIIVFTLMAPITINGIGLREAIFVYILGFYGIENTQALAMAWLEFGLVIVVGLLGGLAFATRPPVDLGEMNSEKNEA